MNIFEYDDSKKYLKDWIKNRPKEGRGEINSMSKFLGIKASLLSAVLSTERNLTMEQAFELNNYLKHSETEAEYFLILLSIERAGTFKLKEHYIKQKKKIIKKSEKIKSRITTGGSITEDQRTLYYSIPYYSMVRVLSTLAKGVSFDEILKVTKIKKRLLKEIIQNLMEMNLIKEKNNRYFSGTNNIHISKESPHYIRHRSNWLIEQLKQAPMNSNNDLNFTCPCTISKNDFEKIKKILLEAISNTHKIINESPAEEMACLTIDFISYFENELD